MQCHGGADGTKSDGAVAYRFLINNSNIKSKGMKGKRLTKRSQRVKEWKGKD